MIALVLLGIHKHISVVNIHYICFVFGCRLTATRISIATLNEKKFCKRKQKIQREREQSHHVKISELKRPCLNNRTATTGKQIITVSRRERKAQANGTKDEKTKNETKIQRRRGSCGKKKKNNLQIPRTEKKQSINNVAGRLADRRWHQTDDKFHR